MGCLGWRIRSSPAKAVSGATFDWAVTQFSLTLSESVGAICADEFTRYLYKQFGWLYWLGIDSVFRHCLWVKWGCVGWRIHSSPLKGVSRATSEWAGTQFSLTVYESIGAVWAEESIRHLGKQFPGLFLSGQRLRFPWLFMSQQGLWGLTNPFVTYESSFRDIFEGAANQFSLTLSESLGLCALTNPFVTFEKSFGCYFWVGSYLVFLDCLWVNRGCGGWRIHSSPAKAVSGAIFEWAATQFSLTLSEAVGAMCADESMSYLFKQFGGLYWLAAIQFSVTVYELIGAVWAGESIRHLRKAFRGLLLSGQRLSFP